MTDCLVSCMSSKHSSLTYHADDEPIIDQNSDICTVSLGPPRKLDFIWKNENNLGRKNVPPPPEYILSTGIRPFLEYNESWKSNKDLA